MIYDGCHYPLPIHHSLLTTHYSLATSTSALFDYEYTVALVHVYLAQCSRLRYDLFVEKFIRAKVFHQFCRNISMRVNYSNFFIVCFLSLSLSLNDKEFI